MKKIAYALVGVTLLLASALAACFYVDLGSDSYVQAKQYEGRDIWAGIINQCSTSKEFTITTGSEVPVSASHRWISLSSGAETKVKLHIAPHNMAPGMYEGVVSARSGNEIVQRAFAIKVIHNPQDVLRISSIPGSIELGKADVYQISLTVQNRGNQTLRNVAIMAKEDGMDPIFSGQPFDLSPGATAARSFTLGGLSEGTHRIRVTAFSGDYADERVVTVLVGEKSEESPFSTILSIEEKNSKYLMKYTIMNTAGKELKRLSVRIEDAPSGWDVVLPSDFSLAVGESAKTEVILAHDGNTDANITIAIYSEGRLMYEQPVELSLERISGGTGLISFGGSFIVGLFLVFFISLAYLIYKKKKAAAELKRDVKSS